MIAWPNENNILKLALPKIKRKTSKKFSFFTRLRYAPLNLYVSKDNTFSFVRIMNNTRKHEISPHYGRR